MKSVVCEEYGAPDRLELRELGTPAPKSNEVLVRVQAASINSWDWDLLRGRPLFVRFVFGIGEGIKGISIGGYRRPKHPTLGCDVAGIVEAVGKDAKKFKVGDEVFGDLSGASWGGFAEYVCAPEDLLARKSPAMTFEEAAALPQAGVLAVQGLRDNSRLSSGQRLLINGAGGGVGTLAIQIAKSIGAEVTAVDKASKLARLRALGADHVVDYTTEDFTRRGQTYDLIVDNVVSRSASDYRRALNPGGTLVMVGGDIPIFRTPLLGFLNRTKKLTILFHKPNPEDLMLLNDHYENGTAKPVVDKTFPLERTADAFRYFGQSEFVGKVVVRVE